MVGPDPTVSLTQKFKAMEERQQAHRDAANAEIDESRRAVGAMRSSREKRTGEDSRTRLCITAFTHEDLEEEKEEAPAEALVEETVEDHAA